MYGWYGSPFALVETTVVIVSIEKCVLEVIVAATEEDSFKVSGKAVIIVLVYGWHGSPLALVEITVVRVLVSTEGLTGTTGTLVTIVVVYGSHGLPFVVVE